MTRKPPRSTEERLVRAQKSMMPGTLGGRVASAAPMALDVTRLDPRIRSNHNPTSGGFDPDADPVVIGHLADGHGVRREVVIGYGASADAFAAMSVGAGSSASDGGDSLFGPMASGPFAVASGDDTTAVGPGAQAAAANAGAFGPGTDSHYANSTAIGAFAICDDIHQIMLGTDDEYVVIPRTLVMKSPDGSRWRITVDNAGAVTTAPF